MIGPVQLMVLGYNQPEAAASLRAKIQELKNDPAIRIIDVLHAQKDPAGNLVTEPVSDLLPEHPHEPGTLIDRLVSRAGATRTMGEQPSTGPGDLFQGSDLPDPRQPIPPGFTVLALLLEHRWAIPLRDAAVEVGAYPAADGWLGRESLQDLQLLPPES